ncbi:integral membrane protein S linking to the trans Golgi network-domain-containing protein [Limtongia smithiae]|uniref:integral membrane protein S linking to the trans Golgi network-domain-containing protein n=1 Tax=Limtongia smithiae TaxID=1125753 RepID=UPI0034CDACBC
MNLKDRRRRGAARSSGRYDSFAPTRLAMQICILQSLYYVTAAALLLFTCLVSGTPFTLELLLSWRGIRIDNTIGWTICLVWCLNSIFNVLYLTLFVGRSKLVFDFVLTIHGINLVITSLYTASFPISVIWWLMQIISIFIMLSLGTWTSRWRELSVLYFPATTSATITQQPHTPTAAFAAGASRNDSESTRHSTSTTTEEFEMVDQTPDLEAQTNQSLLQKS